MLKSTFIHMVAVNSIQFLGTKRARLSVCVSSFPVPEFAYKWLNKLATKLYGRHNTGQLKIQVKWEQQ